MPKPAIFIFLCVVAALAITSEQHRQRQIEDTVHLGTPSEAVAAHALELSGSSDPLASNPILAKYRSKTRYKSTQSGRPVSFVSPQSFSQQVQVSPAPAVSWSPSQTYRSEPSVVQSQPYVSSASNGSYASSYSSPVVSYSQPFVSSGSNGSYPASSAFVASSSSNGTSSYASTSSQPVSYVSYQPVRAGKMRRKARVRNTTSSPLMFISDIHPATRILRGQSPFFWMN